MGNQKETGKQKKFEISRRDFMGTAAAVAAFTFVPKCVLAGSAGNKLNIAGIGVGGQGGKPAGSNFDHAGPLAEAVLLGNVALRPAMKEKLTRVRLLWDSAN